MPSKTKKRSKTPSNPSNSGQSVSSPAISSSASPSETELKEDDICGLLDEAEIEYPSLISKDAFVGRLTDAESYSSSSHTAVIWLSESAMVASSIVSGSIVSVSLAASKKKLENSFPLYPFVNDYARRYNVGAPDKRTNEAGSYFALAVVYPSCKVVKNEVQLSWSLSCTMGNPAPGMTTFVFPIQCHSTVGLPNGFHKGHNFSNISVSCLKLWSCKDLYLELVPSKNDDVLLHTNSKSELDYDRPENGISLSPRTPLPYQSKLNPSSVKHLPLRRCQDSVSNVRPSNGTLFSTYDIGNALGDRKSRELLQVPVAHWLHARHLLHGNFVAIPIGGQIFSFRVEGAREEDSLSIGNNALLPCEAQNLNADCGNSVFIIGQGTKVHLNSSKLLEKQIPVEEGFSSVDLESRDSRDKEACYVPKLGGLAKEFGILKEIIISSSVKSTLSSLGLRTTKGVLLHGPPGTGKTSLALSCVNYAGVNLFSVNGPELISQFFGESEQALHEVFDSASQAAPAVVFIDELDAIAPARKDGSEELSQRMVATLLTLMDGIGTSDGILVIAATNRPNSIDPALRRPGRFDQEIEIGVPSPKQRLDILQLVLSEMTHSLVDTQVQHLALSMHGFVGADIAALCNEAALVCLRRYVNLKKTSDSSSGTVDEVQCKESFVGYNGCSDYILGASDCSNGNTHVIDSGESVSPSNDVIGGSDVSNGTMHVIDSGECVSPSTSYLTASTKAVQSFQFDAEYQRGNYTTLRAVHYDNDKVASKVGEEDFLKVTFDDFEKAKMKVRPSAMREVMLEIPKVSWEDVGGQKEVKMQLMEAVEWPQKHQDAFMRIGTRPPTGVLMFGPPGCSKTLMARAVASEAGLNFLAVKGPELFSKWVGESEKAVKSLFTKARANAPSVIFFDEIDGLAIVRGKESDGASVGDRVMSQLLVELDGLHQRVNVTVIAATNRPDKIDPALLRPGRFDRLLYVGPPNEIDREDIFRIHLQKMPCGSDVSIRELAYLTKGCTGADISLICREAALAAIEESLDTSVISMEHFKIGLGRVQPSDICSYQEFSMKFQRLVLSGAEKDDEEYQPTRILASRIAFGTWLKSLLNLLFRRAAAFSSSKASP